MASIYRNPVPGSEMKKRLRCLEDGTHAICRDLFEALAVGAKFTCQRHHCRSGSFCFPRERKTSHFDHYHQGIDLAVVETDKSTPFKTKFGTPILSVAAGRVVLCEPLEKGTYGIQVMVRSDVPGYGELFFFYSHCQKLAPDIHMRADVAEGQVIAWVGSTGNAKDSEPHLHFEVRTGDHLPLKHEIASETNLDEVKLRLDPLQVLEQLGPWGMRDVYLPSHASEAMNVDIVRANIEKVEKTPRGGYFPLGANNTWHGGVHLDTSGGRTIVAPFDATIVALRLDSDPDRSKTGAGHTNFILLRHEISEPAARLFAGKPLDPATPGDPKSKPVANAVGRGAANANEHVLQAKAGLHGRFDAEGRPFYAPADESKLVDGAADDEFVAAIEAFQATLPRPKKMKKKHPWPDGVMSVGGYTWTALFGPTKDKAERPEPGDAHKEGEGPSGDDTPKPTDPKRTLYSLLMHLGAQPLDAEAAKSFAWLTQAKAPPRPGNADDEALHAVLEERREDEEEARRGISGRVGYPKPAPGEDEPTAAEAGLREDIEWVQQRLDRHGFSVGKPTGEWSEAMRSKIAEFQRKHTDYYADGTGREPPGYVEPESKAKGKKVKPETLVALRTTKAELARGTVKDAKIDPLFAARLAERDAVGTAAVVSGLEIPVRSGNALWISGQAQGYDGPEQSALYDQIHWELFSEHLLVDWEQLVDGDEDLQVDMPDALFELVEQWELGGFKKDKWLVPEELMEFYAHPRSQSLRRTACKFRSEWTVDPSIWGGALRKFGFTKPADELQPFAIWDDAIDVLPASHHVWHYNPIEFLGLYAEILETLRPKPLIAEGNSQLEIRVMYADGQPWSYARVKLAYFAAGEVAVATDVAGLVKLENITPGGGIVWLDEAAPVAQFFDLDHGEHESVTLVAPTVGPEKLTGTLSVLVLDLDDYGKADAAVLVEGDGGPMDARTDDEGRCVLELFPGIYDVTAETASTSVDILANGVREIVLQRTDTGALAVEVRLGDGTPAADVDIVVGDGLAVATTNAGGRVEFPRVVPGLHRVFVAGVGGASAQVQVVSGGRHLTHLVVPLDPGAIDVFVVDSSGFARAGVEVVLRTETGSDMATAVTDAAGLATFDDVNPDTYAVSAEDAIRDELGVRVRSEQRTSVALTLAPKTKPGPKPALATGTLRVTVVYSDGAPVVGTVKVAKQGAGLSASKHLTGTEQGTAVFEDLAANRYRVYLDGYDEHAVDVDVPGGGVVPVMLLLPA